MELEATQILNIAILIFNLMILLAFLMISTKIIHMLKNNQREIKALHFTSIKISQETSDLHLISRDLNRLEEQIALHVTENLVGIEKDVKKTKNIVLSIAKS